MPFFIIIYIIIRILIKKELLLHYQITTTTKFIMLTIITTINRTEAQHPFDSSKKEVYVLSSTKTGFNVLFCTLTSSEISGMDEVDFEGTEDAEKDARKFVGDKLNHLLKLGYDLKCTYDKDKK